MRRFTDSSMADRMSFPMDLQQPMVDVGALDRLRGFGGEKLLGGMIELFTKNAPIKAAEAREALDCGDSAALRAALHALKSSSGQLGAVSLHMACIAGEELASRGELAQCTEHVQQIERDLPFVCRQLNAIRLPS